MFDQLKQLKQLAGLMGNAGEIKAKVEAVQARLEHETVTANAGGGAVRVTVNGHLKITDVQLDPALATVLTQEPADSDREAIEQLIANATNNAITAAQAMIKQHMAELTGGMNLPGMDQLLN